MDSWDDLSELKIRIIRVNRNQEGDSHTQKCGFLVECNEVRERQVISLTISEALAEFQRLAYFITNQTD